MSEFERPQGIEDPTPEERNLPFLTHSFATHIDAACAAVHAVAVAKGFYPFNHRNVGEAIALAHSELSEALEAHRKCKDDDHLPDLPAVAVELADAMLRIMDLAAYLRLPLGQALVKKHAHNCGRPCKHGKVY